MNITDVVKSLSSSLAASSNVAASKQNKQSSATKKTDEPDPATLAFAQANQRVEQQIQKSEVKLSSLGQVKSAVSDLQLSSKALSSDKTTENLANAKQAAQKFVTSFNTANKTVSKAVSGEGKTPGVLADEGRTRVAANEISRALSSNPALVSDLKSIGITAENGTLKVDLQKLGQSFQSNPNQVGDTLARAGQQVERTASKQLEGTGNLGRSINTLSSQVRDLESQQTNQQNLAASVQRASEDANNRLNANNSAGVAAYQKVFNL